MTSSDVFNEEYKRLIAGRARTLLERLENPDAFEHAIRDESEAKETFEQWEGLLSTEGAFDRRLENAGATREDCLRATTVDKLADDAPLPEWIDVLDDLVATVQSQRPEEGFRKLRSVRGDATDDGQTNRAFGEVSAAIAAYALDRPAAELPKEVLPESVLGELTEWFRDRFEDRFVRILFVEFKTFVAAHDEELAFASPDEFEDPPTEHYDRFVEYLFSGGVSDLCQEYPMFARLVVTQIRQWNEHLYEFSRRLQADRERLAERFDVDGQLGAVTDLEPLADDTHGDGRAVMRVEFESGLEVAYKPRSVDAGATFYEVLARLDDHLALPEFETPTYLARDDYGWMEWIEHAECEDERAVERYYQRAGALTCVAYFLQFTDCQFENLIVAGEQPMLVDAETVLHPHFATDKKPFRTDIGTLSDDSVLLTGLLPFGTQSSSDENALEKMGERASGFGVSSEETNLEGVESPVMKGTNTDVMSIEHEPAPIDRSTNIPTIDGVDQSPEAHVSDIVGGFETTYETLLRLRDDGRLSEDVGLPDAFESVENRIVYRATVRYASVLRSLSSRENLHDGATFGLSMEQLALPFCDGRTSDSELWSLYDAERRSLKRLDPPRFTCRTDGREIRMDGTRLGVEADASGMERCRQRVESASREDMREQIEFIRSCFGASPDPNREAGAPPTSDREPVGEDELRREATSIFERVRSAALRTDDGRYHWASVAPQNETERLTLRPSDESLYTGWSGIAFLGAALYRISGEEQYRQFALDTLDPVREAVQSDLPSPTLTKNGGTDGLGSVAYGLGAVGGLLEDDSLLEDADRVADLITPEIVADDDTYDVATGAAGTILGLLAAHDRTGSRELVSAAAECGNHLLESRVATDGVRVWETLDDCPPLTGFAHGASGIAYALGRLWDATGDSAYRDAALEALEYEAQSFSEATANWPDYREWTDTTYFDQWCYGRSGIGLARLGTAEYVSDDLVTQGIERAVEGFPMDRIAHVDHLCCGEAGRAEFLLEAARRRDLLRGEARNALGGIVARKRETGTYRTLAETDRIPNPTFFHGSSGIAYTMLRSLDPEALPCVLLWE